MDLHNNTKGIGSVEAFNLILNTTFNLGRFGSRALLVCTILYLITVTGQTKTVIKWNASVKGKGVLDFWTACCPKSFGQHNLAHLCSNQNELITILLL
jgi:hypothetical protein